MSIRLDCRVDSFFSFTYSFNKYISGSGDRKIKKFLLSSLQNSWRESVILIIVCLLNLCIWFLWDTNSIVFKICSVKNKVLKRLYTIFFPCLGSDLFFSNIPFLCFCIIISNLWYVGEYALLTLPDSLSILLHTAPWIQDAHVDGYHAWEHLCWL